MARYGMQTRVEGQYDEVRERLTAALMDQGFGILSEIDVQQTLKAKLDVDIERYEILGACNPGLAHQALTAERSVGLLLPCNVVLRSVGNQVEVSILDPEVMFEVADEKIRSDLAPLAKEAKARLQRVIEKISGS